ncbi:hypothetical protein [Streptomyces jeddahensis]|uniref:Uncharacterized protein n=1 Tax=Streptomyces jeddahensis TaxID=1716141 RepID=A0A177HMT0_9ACTN|nr:hypothetical protein [Streptomyces jeddahensis]OAH12205.1 hypothetical protein STSP_44000 [Streptomyces jeddahensis]
MSLGQLADSRSTTLPACAGDADSQPAPAEGAGADAASGYLLAAPDPCSCTAAPPLDPDSPLETDDQRLAARDQRLAAPDQRVVDLHTALTAAGVPPEAGDTAAIHVLAALDDETVHAVIRWVRGRFAV